MIWEAIVDFVYPKTCVGCAQWGSFLCEECIERLDIVDQICPMCGEESPMGWTHKSCKKDGGLDGLIAIFEYKEPVMRAVIDGIKYGFNRELVKIALKDFSFESGVVFDFLVPVPLYYYRENWRGFNQAYEIAVVVGESLKMETNNVLKRNRNTKQQVLMRTKEERYKNIQGAFEVQGMWLDKLKGKKILLVDDVFTSGADMNECARVLSKAGVETVWGLALSH